MRRSPIVVLVLLAVGAWFAAQQRLDAPRAPTPASRTSTPAATPRADDSLARAIARRAQDVQVTGEGTVVKLLRDDDDGSPHQRFLLDVGAQRTVLIAHNLALAPRVAPLAVGDRVEFAGEFVWNEKGGVVHWTHPDPRGRHRAGYARVVPR